VTVLIIFSPRRDYASGVQQLLAEPQPLFRALGEPISGPVFPDPELRNETLVEGGFAPLPHAAQRMKPVLSVVVPVFNESENVLPLAAEIVSALRGLGPVELIFVDDASRDSTVDCLRSSGIPGLRVIRHRVNAGQSAAVATGFRGASADWVATLDGDGQNDPADLPAMYEKALRDDVDCVTGVRARRRDHWIRRLSSKIANRFRNAITGDRISDSGCGIRVVRKAALREIPVFNGMHRFLPTLLRGQGSKVSEYTVNHRERTRGVSKYGVHNRLWRGIRDCFGIRWYLKRTVPANRLEEAGDE